MNNYEKFYLANRLIDIVPEHCFDVTLANFEEIINNDFIQLEAELLSDINYFSQEVKQIWNNFCVISLNVCTIITKTSKFNNAITYFF